MNIDRFIFDTFLQLTSTTCPYGFEDQFLSDFRNLFPSDLQKDTWGNYSIKIGESKTIFASHIDTVSKDYQKVTHVISKNIISTDGKTTLGADDKAGVTLMLWMIKNRVPGLYYFFIGEEVGCIGSGAASSGGDFSKYDRIISFDRRGNNSVITHQSSTRCCSDDFAKSLASELNRSKMNYKLDDGGVYTDSAEFMTIIPECTNLSVGYNKEHTFSETQDIHHLIELAAACVKVDWENLPTKRDPKVKEYKENWGNWAGYSKRDTKRSYGYHDDWYGADHCEPWKKTRRSKKNRKSRYQLDMFEEDDSYLSSESPYLGDFSEFGLSKSTGNRYEWLVSKLTSDQFSLEEIETIREQYFSPDNAEDAYFYDYLVEQYWESHSLGS